MKILIGMPAKDSWGGPASSEPPFVEALRQTGLAEVTEKTYIYGDKAKPTPFLERIRRVTETALGFRLVLRKQKFDIIHLNTAFDLKTLMRDAISLYLMKPKKTKVFFKFHGSESKYLKSRNFLIVHLRNILKKRVSGFGIHALEERDTFVQAGFDPEKLYFVKNAVTIAKDLPEKFARIHKEKEEIFKLLFVARFISAKGLLETIRASAILKEKGFCFALTCVGDGETRVAAEAEVARLGLVEQVTFTGYIPETEVTNYFLASDIFVFPTSHAEGFSNVLFKAVAAGLPIVTTPVRTAKDYLRASENCLFSTREPENIAGEIIKLIENKFLREKMCENNLQFGKTLLPEKIAQEFLEIYEKILGGKDVNYCKTLSCCQPPTRSS